MVKVGIVQAQAEPFKVDENLTQAEQLIRQTVKEGARLVVLPEMFNVGFSFDEKLMSVAETLEGKTINWLKTQAAKHNIYITGSLYERLEGDFYNTMVMAGSDGSLQFYRKRNPTMQESTVWRRCSEPGPGIFDTPFGRIGGVICFDSFTRETFEGFKQSGVELVIIIALWGRPQFIWYRPEMVLAGRLLKRWSCLAAEVVPYQYATQLGVPAIFVNQGGTTQSPSPKPSYLPIISSIPNFEFVFWGNSHVRDASGDVLVRAGEGDVAFTAVVSIDIKQKEKRPAVTRSDIPINYLKAKYYFVEPPFLAKVFQHLSVKGHAEEYQARCRRH